MKNLFALIFNVLILSAGLYAQSECKAYFPFEENAEMEYTFYDAKGKVESSAQHKVTVVDHLDGGLVEAQVMTAAFDKKGEKSFDGQYQVRCDGNTLYMNMSDMMPASVTQAFSSMEVTIEGDPLAVPYDLKEGQTLPNAYNTIKAASGGLNLMTATFEATDRKVLGRETVDTPVGKLTCWKTSQTTSVKMIVRRTSETISWFHEEMGLVKQETYNKKGKLESTMLLTKFNKG